MDYWGGGGAKGMLPPPLSNYCAYEVSKIVIELEVLALLVLVLITNNCFIFLNFSPSLF